MRPIVGITSSPVRQRNAVLEVDRSLSTLDRAYVDAVDAAGGVAVVLPLQRAANADAVIDRLDGLLLSGGGDVAPERYRAERHPQVGGVDEERDEWEVRAIAAARRRGIPILAICRGIQILNVSMGGTLIQHLPDHADGDPHLMPSRFAEAAHAVELTAGSSVAKVLDTELLHVNTLHHQAIDRCADELVVVARDEHGIVEAVEHPEEPIIGVQWHPELIVRFPPHERLFDWLITEAAAVRNPG